MAHKRLRDPASTKFTAMIANEVSCATVPADSIASASAAAGIYLGRVILIVSSSKSRLPSSVFRSLR